MMWFRVDKAAAVPPQTGGYRAWKVDLRKEGREQCVYCCVHESSFGGYRNFHVEHYKPKSIFSELRDKYENLFYACSICNTFKSDVWPGDPAADHSIPAFPDPSKNDYSNFMLLGADGLVAGANVAASYTIERLNLNRPQLVIERKVRALEDRLLELVARASVLIKNGKMSEELGGLLADSVFATITRSRAIPYDPQDVSR